MGEKKTVQQTIEDTLAKHKDVLEKKGGIKKIEHDNEILGSIHYNDENVIVGIQSEYIFLIYHTKIIMNDPKEYFFMQLIEHNAYDHMINKNLRKIFDATDSAYKTQHILEENSEFYPAEFMALIKGIKKIRSTVSDWLHRKNYRKTKKDLEDNLETLIVYNNMMQEAMNDRKEYMEKEILPKVKEISDEAYADAKQMIKVQDNIVNTHSRIVLEAGKQLNVLQEYIMKML